MTKGQFWLLNAVSALLIVTLFLHLFLSRGNNKLGQQLNNQRAYINNARQLQPVLENLARRVAAGGETDPKLKALLTKYDIKVSLPPEPKPADPGPAPAAPKAKSK